MKQSNRRPFAAWIITPLLVLLTACGGAQEIATTAASPSSAPADTPTVAATPSATATVPASPTVAQAAPSPQPATATTAPSASVAPENTFAGLQQSTTAEGYPVLGNPDAPITITMYSDFL